MRKATVTRKTNETNITVSLNLDGSGKVICDSGNGFFDHMINAFGRHANYDIEISCSGDIHVDFHHSAEDIGIVLGAAFAKCTADKAGMVRFGQSFVPMDESLVQAVSDISGRAFLVFNADIPAERVGSFETEITEEFFRAFAYNAKITLHINMIYGKNSHHIIEAMFKSCGCALAQSSAVDGDSVLSTKGVL